MTRLILAGCCAALLAFMPRMGLATTPWTLLINTNNVIVVTNATYGAIGDGIFTNTIAVSKRHQCGGGGWFNERTARR